MRLLLASLLLASLLLCACSVPAVSPDGAKEAAIFPHPEGFAEAGQHGQSSLGEDALACPLCHEPEGSEAPGATGCRSCHAQYPHGIDWLDLHGAAWQDLDTRSTCAPCHGEQLAGGASDVACDSCHAAWPHPVGWRVGAAHAAFLAERGTLDACLACHEVTPAEGELPGCGDCHIDYPHAEGWVSGAEHGAAWLDESCGTCHGDANQGGVLAPACANCHAAYPHGSDWLADHPAAVSPVGAEACMACHEPGDGADDLPISCAATCHGVAP